MRLPAPWRALGAAGAIAVLACSPASRDPAPDTAATRPAAPATSAATAPDAWYRRARPLDLTGDGRADTARLEARGARPDSLDVLLTLVVGDSATHREAWGSSYELALVDPADRVGPAAAEILRARLDSVLASVTVRRLDDPSVRLMTEDRPVLAGLRPRPTHIVSFAYGYETTTRLVWDAPRARFVRLWSCC